MNGRKSSRRTATLGSEQQVHKRNGHELMPVFFWIPAQTRNYDRLHDHPGKP